MKFSKNTNRNNRSLVLNANTNTNSNRKTNCYLHECNTNTYAHVLNKPPIFRLKPPPNPLNFNLNPESLFFSSKANLIKTSNENEQFLHYLNLNESLTTTNQHIHNSHFHNHQSVNYYAEKCTNLRLYQIASSSTYSLTNNFAFKHLNNEFPSSKNETLHFLPTKSIVSTITTTVQSQIVGDGLNGGEIATNSITNVKSSNGLVLFSSMSLIAISVLFLLFYLYYHYFYSR